MHPPVAFMFWGGFHALCFQLMYLKIVALLSCHIGSQFCGPSCGNFDIAVENEGKINTCSKCSTTCSKEISICLSCQFDANNYPQNFNPYYWTESKHPVEKPIIHIGEPCMVNPNSFESLKNVLNHVSATNSVKMKIIINGFY